MELLLLGLLALIIFGPAKLPDIGRTVGRSLREFKDSVSGMGEVRDTISTVNDIRSSMSVSGLANAVLPEVKETRDALTGGDKAAAAATAEADAPPPSAAKPAPATGD
jgi:sec-independent protein translocase protein TatA